jgi:hypothetical protein
MYRSVTHLPGFPVLVFDRLIQRCGICGTKLVDSGRSKVRLRRDGSFNYPHYEEFVPVRFGRRGKVRVLERDASDLTLPRDNCLELVEEVL